MIGLKVDGCAERPIATIEDAMSLVQEATQRRSVAATSHNAHSSRSHALVSIKVRETTFKRSSLLITSYPVDAGFPNLQNFKIFQNICHKIVYANICDFLIDAGQFSCYSL